MDADSLAKVTEGQRACLRMVLLHMSSKDIARSLGISRHTVDQRLKLAMKTLGAASRVEAARTLAAMEGADEYQRLTYQASDIESAGPRSSLTSLLVREDKVSNCRKSDGSSRLPPASSSGSRLCSSGSTRSLISRAEGARHGG